MTTIGKKILLTKKTKVYIHLEQLIPYTNIYHIGISFRSIFKTIRYDLRWIDLPLINETTTNSYTFFWDHSDYKISEIIDYENDLDYTKRIKDFTEDFPTKTYFEIL